MLKVHGLGPWQSVAEGLRHFRPGSSGGLDWRLRLGTYWLEGS